MSDFGLKSANTTLVPDSPAVKRQKTPSGYNSTGNSTGYNSGADSGDDLFEGIITTPAAKHYTQPTQLIDRTPAAKQFSRLTEVIDVTPTSTRSTEPTQIIDRATTVRQFTQPTQIVDRNTALSSPDNITSPEVQIPASSPFRQHLTSRTNNISSAPKAGRLASLMAPAGTSFRAPYSTVAPRPAKKPVVIDLSDDDGAQYKGGSSDDDSPSRGEIKPSTFLPKSKKFSLTGNGANSSSPIGSESSRQSRFNDIMANSKFDPTKSATGLSLTGSIFDSRNRDPRSTSSHIVTPAVKKVPDSISMGYGSQRRPQAQSRPERAIPVPQDISVDDEQDRTLRRKIYRIQQLNPGAYTVLMIRNAILRCKGNVDDAAALLMEPAVGISADENGNGSKGQQNHLNPQMKRQLEAPVKSILERYSSTQNSRKVAQPVVPVVTPPKKPRRRLQQGRRHPSSPAPIVIESPKPEIIELIREQSDVDSDDSGIGTESEEDPELEGRVLAFINRCEVEDLADLANIKLEVAAKMIAERPFQNLNAAREVSDGSTTKTGKKSSKAPIGEKIVQTAVDMWSGYEAVDALVAKCEQHGKPLAEEISKWGFDVFGAAKTGELEMVSFDDDSDSQRDSGLGTPSSKAASTNGEAGEDDIKTATQFRHGRQNKLLKQPAMMSDNITLKDYQLVGLNWLALLYKHKLSCILADDMGLGKTCQVIAFLSHLAEIGVSGPHLVIVPPSTLENWLREFQFFCPNLVVEPYYGMY
jgi:SWI/SNF-related matrix-associated actin-dependent regulator of chromatin subfamily A containing DEAD/H box 1